MLYSANENAMKIGLTVFIVLALAAFIVYSIFSNKKRQQTVDNLHNSLNIGDKIMTIGGIIGIVTDIKQVSAVDKEFTIETGEEGKKTTMTLDIKALYQIITPVNASASASAVSKPAPASAEAAVEVASEEAPVESEENAPAETSSEVVAEAAEEKAEEAKEEAKEEEAPAEGKPAAKPRTKKSISKK